MKNCMDIFFLKLGNHPVTVLFWYISFFTFPIFKFPLYIFFVWHLKKNLMPFYVSEFAGFKNIYTFLCKKKNA